MEACISGNPVNYLLDPPVKKCSECREVLGLESFYRDKKRDLKGWTGVRSKCKNCEKIKRIKNGTYY
jgi:RNase P subunit RPR2